MIHTSRQLKALVRNMSKGDSDKALVIIRNYAMERFLERLSLSKYKDKLIIKGGILVASMVGIDNRSTMDVDATLKNLPLDESSIKAIITEITQIQIEDGMSFEISSITPIMDEADYPGYRAILNTTLESMKTPLKIDFSTGDVITPHEIEFSYKLMFEERSIAVLAYNIETILAEKLETILSRGSVNSRMRDFYDVHILTERREQNINISTLKDAFSKTCEKRGSTALLKDVDLIIKEIFESEYMSDLWQKYQEKFDYAVNVTWDVVMKSVKNLMDMAST